MKLHEQSEDDAKQDGRGNDDGDERNDAGKRALEAK